MAARGSGKRSVAGLVLGWGLLCMAGIRTGFGFTVVIAERGHHWVGAGRVLGVRWQGANESPVWRMQPCTTALFRSWRLTQMLDWCSCRSCSCLAVVLLFPMLSLIGTSLGMWCLFLTFASTCLACPLPRPFLVAH